MNYEDGVGEFNIIENNEKESSDSVTIIFMIVLLFAIYIHMLCTERRNHYRY